MCDQSKNFNALIGKNLLQNKTPNYLYTSMVSHRGVPISFAMAEGGKIFYSVLDMSNTEQNAGNDENDKNYWSKVHPDKKIGQLHFPQEIARVGYGLVPNIEIDKYKGKNEKVISSYNSDGKPLDASDNKLTDAQIKDDTDPFYSSTARLGAVAPFQALSDGKYVYIFRQSIARSDSNTIVDNTLLVDRFILSGTILKLSREIRYQRSRHKTEPESRKDTLSPVDVEGNPFYEPTRELAFANNLSNGNFSVLLLPGKDTEEQRWQIFTADSETGKINSFNIRFDYSLVFDTSDSQALVDEFIQEYDLDRGAFITKVQTEIGGINGSDDDTVVATTVLSDSAYQGKDIPEDALAETIYTLRTGVIKDDFIPASESYWPLIEYDGGEIKDTYSENGKLKAEYAFNSSDKLMPLLAYYKPVNGLSSCYYYQQEMGADNKPMKNKACVMLAMGLEDTPKNQYIGMLNFSVAGSGRLSQLTTDTVNLPDINVQALDENPYARLEDIPTKASSGVALPQPQKMSLIDIDTNGLSTSGGVMKFAYTSAEMGTGEGYSDAVKATAPYLFDDSLGRVNLYFKGMNNNFFVLYFNPTGSKGITITDSATPPVPVSPPLSFVPRLDRDMKIMVSATIPTNPNNTNPNNTCSLTMKATPGDQPVEQWDYLPRRLSQIAAILNGNGELPLGTLEPLGDAGDPRAAYLESGNGKLSIHTTVNNNLLFNTPDDHADQLGGGAIHSLALSDLSAYLANNTTLHIAGKSFSIVVDSVVGVKADIFYKAYLSDLVDNAEDVDQLWGLLIDKALVAEISVIATANAVEETTVSESAFLAGDTTLTVTSAANWDVAEGDYLQIGQEILRVSDVYGNDIAVSRGQLGTSAAEHARNATVTYVKCRINGALTADAASLTVTSAAALGIARGDYLKMDREILLVEGISGNKLTISRGQKSTAAASHANGSVVTIDQKGVVVIKGQLLSAALSKTEEELREMITDDSINALSLQWLQQGNDADKKARRSGLINSLIDRLRDVAKTRIVTVEVQDNNTQSVDRLEAGLEVSVAYNSAHFACTPAHLGGTSAPAWEHPRSYLFDARFQQGEAASATTEIADTFNYCYDINNTIGQWEDWEASLALEFDPASAAEGALLSADNNKLGALQPTEKGLSVEAWIKPSGIPGDSGSIIYYEKQGEQHYSLGIEKVNADPGQYRCVATLGTNKYTSTESFDFNLWTHMAFAHKKYWGYKLIPEEFIDCGHDDSLNLTDEFTLEVLVKIDKGGTLLEKMGEYRLWVDSDNEVAFGQGDTNYLEEWVEKKYRITYTIANPKNLRYKKQSQIDSLIGPLINKPNYEMRLRPPALNMSDFYKITLIRSKNEFKEYYKEADYPRTGNSRGSYDLSLMKVDTLTSTPIDKKKNNRGLIIFAKTSDEQEKQNKKEVLIRFIGSAEETKDFFYPKDFEDEERKSDKEKIESMINEFDDNQWDLSNLDEVQKNDKIEKVKSATGHFPKWYENVDDTDELLKGMAEKQDQMESKMDFAQPNMFGQAASPASDPNPTYYHTLIVTKSNDDENPIVWTTPTPREVSQAEAYKTFKLGGGSFKGTFASVRIWNRALSESEAKAHTLPENKTGLLSHWRMAEGKGNYLYDNVSENHGVATGGAWTDSPQTDQPEQFRFYVNGTPEPHNTPTDHTAAGNDQFSLGGIKASNETASGSHFKGTLEEIRIWNRPRTHEQITDNAFGRLKGEWEQLLANYTFDKRIGEDNIVQDAGANGIHLTTMFNNNNKLTEVLSTAPVATEIPRVRSALTGIKTDYHGTIHSRPAVVEYGDVQKNDDGTLSGILKRCYSFIDTSGNGSGAWNRMTGYKVGNLVSQWYGQAQFAPQVMGYLEGSPPVPAENFPIAADADVNTYAFKLNNSAAFQQAEEVSYNYSTSKEAGWNVAVDSEMKIGLGTRMLIAPLGFGMSFKIKIGLATASHWNTSGNRSESYERGTSVNTGRTFGAALAGYDNGASGDKRYYKLGNTGYALVKSKTADIYLLRLAHNNALVSISWQPNPDIPEDVNIIPFPINPLYTKQGTLDGKFGETTDAHYPQAHGAYGQYSYFKPREAYKLKKQIEREKAELKVYFEDSFDVAKTNEHFRHAVGWTGVSQFLSFIPGITALGTSIVNQTLGQVATQVGYHNTQLKKDMIKMGSQRNLVNTYVWTIEGGFFAESTEVAETQQETYANDTSLSLGGGIGVAYQADEGGPMFEQKALLSSGSSFTLTKSKTKSSKTSFGLDINVGLPTSPRYQYAGADARTLTKGLIKPGTVDAYRFMSFYLEPKGKNFTDLFTQVIDPIWLEESPDPNAQALRQARGDTEKAKPCWRIMHRVTYVSRILPEFQPEAPPSLEKALRIAGIESNYMLIKKFEPYVAAISDSGDFFSKIEEVIDQQLPEFDSDSYRKKIKDYLALYFNIGQA